VTGWIRLSDWVEGGAIGVTERTARRWIRQGIGGEIPPAEAARLIGGRWWVFPRRFEAWLMAAGMAVAGGGTLLAAGRDARVRAVWHKWRGRFPLQGAE